MLLKLVLAAGILAVLSFAAIPSSVISPAEEGKTRIDIGSGEEGLNAGPQGEEITVQGGSQGSGTTAGKTFSCASGKNGGNTDRGISASRIKLAATNVRSGNGESFLGTAWVGMQAVVNKVNAQGGICGRQLSLRLVDDGWDGPRGAGFIKNFTAEDYFALPVVPSSEGLTLAIQNKTIQSAGIPVIGTDGMLKEQYADPWVWPVAAATVSQVRVIAKHALGGGQVKTCGIVFDKFYKFGREGATAFRDYAGPAGCAVKAFIGIDPGRGSYSGEINEFNNGCSPECDLVVMLLEPGTASTWIAGQPFADIGGVRKKRGFGKVITSGAQPLFNRRFGRDCGTPCGEMLVWTGYNPPIGGNASNKDVANYVNDVRSVVPDVDVDNQFLEGAYLGMSVFVDALKKIGPNVTRAGVRDLMNRLSHQSGIAPTLKWGAQSRFANCGAQPFRMVLAGGGFDSFGETGTGFIQDPECGKVPKD